VEDNPLRNIDADGMASGPPDVFASTFIDPSGTVIKHIDDNDNNVYYVADPSTWNGSKKNLPVIGFEDPKKKYKRGDHYDFYYDKNGDDKLAGKRFPNQFRKGKQKDRDNDLEGLPPEFVEWFHKYYLKGALEDQTEEEIAEALQDWIAQGRPKGPGSGRKRIKPEDNYPDEYYDPMMQSHRPSPVVGGSVVGGITITILEYSWLIAL
jgi:hypothetical protein